MTRSTAQRIRDALVSIEKCKTYTSVLSEDSSFNEMALEAIERNLQILGEAVKRLPAEMTELYPDVPWVQIRGFGNILVHRYFGADRSVIEDVVENHLPPLADALNNALADLEESPS